jgi:glycerophosphoryl diester phosphodiesterase
MRADPAAGSWAWLVRRPIAHRGLHDRSTRIIENTLTAARGAVAAGYAIECDVQISADGEAMVFHDEGLERLGGVEGELCQIASRHLSLVPLGGSNDTMPTLPEFLAVLAGRVPLVCEIKSRFDGDFRLAERVAALTTDYPGPIALKSFDPAVIAHLRRRGSALPLGIVTEARYDDERSRAMPQALRLNLIHLLHFAETRPDFLSYCVDDLPHAAPHLCRTALGLPVMAWTVRTEAQARHAALWADQIVFEGLRP